MNKLTLFLSMVALALTLPNASAHEVKALSEEVAKEYDPALAQLCAEVLGDHEWRFVSPRKRVGQGHLKNYDPEKAPIVKDADHIRIAGLEYFDEYWEDYWQRLHEKYPEE